MATGMLRIQPPRQCTIFIVLVPWWWVCCYCCFLLVVNNRVDGFRSVHVGVPKKTALLLASGHYSAKRSADDSTDCGPSLLNTSSLSSPTNVNVATAAATVTGISTWECDPRSETTRAICCETLCLTNVQYEQLLQLTTLVCDWNERLNLVSRKDCNEVTVFTRHVLPCLAMYQMRSTTVKDEGESATNTLQQSALELFQKPHTRVLDVGTGGGFPGLPLAIQYPHAQFVLADSVGKKVAAVADMAACLSLTNVQTYHGRVEDYFTSTSTTAQFHVVTGRSVTALPQFCYWIQDLLHPETGHLVYWIGGDIESDILQHALASMSIVDLIPGWRDDGADKKVLIFTATAVRAVAALYSGAKTPVVATKTRTRKNSQDPAHGDSASRKKLAKGSWQKKDGPRQRGYENFQRYSSKGDQKDDSNANPAVD
jgi:16S rRNA (guanine527-N7)-methyltransferase